MSMFYLNVYVYAAVVSIGNLLCIYMYILMRVQLNEIVVQLLLLC